VTNICEQLLKLQYKNNCLLFCGHGVCRTEHKIKRDSSLKYSDFDAPFWCFILVSYCSPM